MNANTAEIVALAQAALDAYEDRFESTTGKGNFTGPIDEEMKALRKALAAERTPGAELATDGPGSVACTHGVSYRYACEQCDCLDG